MTTSEKSVALVLSAYSLKPKGRLLSSPEDIDLRQNDDRLSEEPVREIMHRDGLRPLASRGQCDVFLGSYGFVRLGRVLAVGSRLPDDSWIAAVRRQLGKLGFSLGLA